MKRFHALEWEDLQWFPVTWRDYGTDYLSFIANTFHIYEPIIPVIERGLAASKNSEWVDCASGGGGGLTRLVKSIEKNHTDLKITLTDYYPNVKAFERTKSTAPAVFNYETTSVDARNLPHTLHKKFRTLFGAFHHFRPNDALQILQNAVDTNSPIAIFEPVGRNFASFFSMLFVILNVLLLTPFIRPVRWSVLIFIYIIPIIPLYIFWDGLASIFRIYSVQEMTELTRKLKVTNEFDWEIGSKKKGPIPVLYMIGTPKK